MDLKRFSTFVFLAGIYFGGCASSFNPRLGVSDLKTAGLPTAKEVREGLEVSLEEFVTPHKSRKAFDATLAPNGVLPILVRLENRGTETYKVKQDQVRAILDGQPLAQLYGYEAAQQGALRQATWNALVNTAAIGPLAMFFWPATMAGAANQTQTVNRQVEYHFERIEITDSLLKPDETFAGFAFFRIPDGQSRLENLAIEVTVESEPTEGSLGRPSRFRFPLPPLDVRN